jgi:hypothetical protein
MMKRIKHNDLTHYFLRPHSELPQAYLASCEKFFKEYCYMSTKRASKKQVDKQSSSAYIGNSKKG